MKTIETAAKEYQTKIYEDVFEEGSLSEQKLQCINDFKAGIAFAEEWISVKDELPEIKEKLYQIFTKDLSGLCSVVMIKDISDIEHIKYYYTHWRPINRK